MPCWFAGPVPIAIFWANCLQSCSHEQGLTPRPDGNESALLSFSEPNWEAGGFELHIGPSNLTENPNFLVYMKYIYVQIQVIIIHNTCKCWRLYMHIPTFLGVGCCLPSSPTWQQKTQCVEKQNSAKQCLVTWPQSPLRNHGAPPFIHQQPVSLG